MDLRAIPHTELPHASRLFLDYVYDFPRVSRFYPLSPASDESFARAAEFQYSDELRKAVVGVLREGNEFCAAGPETFRNLDRLEKAGCFAVVTGQQVGLFGGPAFAIYKALTAIKLARSLTERGIEAVPIFWLATEDHDFAEVNHCHVQNRDGNPVRLQYSEPPTIPNAPVGTAHLNEGIRPLLDALRAAMPATSDAEEIVSLVEDCYRPGTSFGHAFGLLFARLFRDHGVVLVDSSEPRLHQLSASVFRSAIEAAPEIIGDLLARNELLTTSGYHAQVRVTGNSSLLFLFEEGQRTPLRMENGRFISSRGQSYSDRELLQLLDGNAHLFSPNVLLRPVMQDALLPTIAYVGGPSELAYFAQAAAVYNRVLGRMPVVVPRASFTVMDSGTRRRMDKYALSLADACAGTQALRERIAAHFMPPGLTSQFEQTASDLRRNLNALQASLAQLDPTLADAANTSAQKMQYQLANLERKAAAALQRRAEQIGRDAERLENTLCPERTPQERYYAGISLLAHHGLTLLDHISQRISNKSPDHRVISL